MPWKNAFASVTPLVLGSILLAVPQVRAQSNPATVAVAPAADGAGIVLENLPTGYVVGPEDVLGVLFWREPDMSGDVTVRPDGFITLPLIGEVKAAGLKPESLREIIHKAASKYLNQPNVTIVVRQLNSQKVFITGEVAMPGPYPLASTRTVLQLISMAGGLNEYAKGEGITIVRMEAERTRSFKFNYKDVSKGKKLEQNIVLQPGDTVVVP